MPEIRQNLERLRQHLNDEEAVVPLYRSEQNHWDEALRGIYIEIRAAVRDGVSVIVLNSEGMTCKNASGDATSHWDFFIYTLSDPPIDMFGIFRNAFDRILRTDSVVAQYLHPISETDDEVIYQFAES